MISANQASNGTPWREHNLPGLLGVLGPLLSKRENEHWLYGLRIRKDHLNQANIVHGGTVTALMDQALSTVGWSHTNKTPCVTVQLNVSFLGSAAEGDLLIASGRIVRATGSLLFADGSITVNDAVIATAQAILKRINPS